MTDRLTRHLHDNTVAYIALAIALLGGGGGGYAVAATTHPAAKRHRAPTMVTACAGNKSGEMFLHRRGRCARGRHKVRWSIRGPRGRTGAAGAPAPSIFAAVDTDLTIGNVQTADEKGMTVQRAGVGVYTVTITDPTCARSGQNVPVVTPLNRYASGQAIPPAGATPVAFIDNSVGPPQFTVHVGYTDGGSFVPVDYYFDVQDTCVPSGAKVGASRR